MGEAAPAGPVRMCVGCRGRDARSTLLRVVVVAREDVHSLIIDRARCLPGRGAWIHARAECVDLAVRRKAFGRALRATTGLDPSDVREQIVKLAVQEQLDTGAEGVGR
ncbi:YlxR family protein [Austwickia chelonae]|uniref:YlxR family protein n=1 Tax=Austwickia chelonae TaxID=100225 RepID=UPI000E2776CF|nr:YlxR family protein [Austwickia chelonae]